MEVIDGWSVITDQLKAVHVWPASGSFVSHEVEFLRKGQHYSLREKNGLLAVWSSYHPTSDVQGPEVLLGIYSNPTRMQTIPF